MWTEVKKLVGKIGYSVEPYHIAGIFEGDSLVRIINNTSGQSSCSGLKKPAQEVVSYDWGLVEHGTIRVVSFLLTDHEMGEAHIRVKPTPEGLFARKDFFGSLEADVAYLLHETLAPWITHARNLLTYSQERGRGSGNNPLPLDQLYGLKDTISLSTLRTYEADHSCGALKGNMPIAPNLSLHGDPKHFYRLEIQEIYFQK